MVLLMLLQAYITLCIADPKGSINRPQIMSSTSSPHNMKPATGSPLLRTNSVHVNSKFSVYIIYSVTHMGLFLNSSALLRPLFTNLNTTFITQCITSYSTYIPWCVVETKVSRNMPPVMSSTPLRHNQAKSVIVTSKFSV